MVLSRTRDEIGSERFDTYQCSRSHLQGLIFDLRVTRSLSLRHLIRTFIPTSALRLWRVQETCNGPVLKLDLVSKFLLVTNSGLIDGRNWRRLNLKSGPVLMVDINPWYEKKLVEKLFQSTSTVSRCSDIFWCSNSRVAKNGFDRDLKSIQCFIKLKTTIGVSKHKTRPFPLDSQIKNSNGAVESRMQGSRSIGLRHCCNVRDGRKPGRHPLLNHNDLRLVMSRDMFQYWNLVHDGCPLWDHLALVIVELFAKDCQPMPN
ncbi:hypothetical protein J6590_013221 [Homalodisca vitripennis]|nr:hypothetical protein J6590_013221 [Homalodisca vitripennis]